MNNFLSGSLRKRRKAKEQRNSSHVYTYEEFITVTEDPQFNRMTAIGQDTDNKIIIYKYAMYKIAKTQYRQLYVYRSDMCKFEMKNKYV